MSSIPDKFDSQHPWTLTASGRTFSFGEKNQKIYIKDLAAGLAKICRFAGATTQFYSVAQHSVLVSQIALYNTRDYKTALCALLHDAHEAFIGDVTMPAKCAINNAIGFDAIAIISERADEIIYNAFGLPWPLDDETAHEIKRADLSTLATELRDVMPETGRDWDHLPKPINRVIQPWPWPKAEEKFLGQYEELNAMVRT